MCGIVGFVQREPAQGLLTPMLERIERRGPDGEGRWSAALADWHVSLGHRRLAIIDIAGGAQPMATEDGTACITYNGELYNFRELRDSLEKRGTVFHTHSDTEVLLKHTALHGAGGLAALSGMFAFALVDSVLGKVLLARDRVGIKPLYYSLLSNGGLVFASELTALMQHPEVGRKLSTRGLASYFFSDYAHAPETLISGVKKLAPGHFLEWTRGKAGNPTAYWRLSDSGVAPGARRRNVSTFDRAAFGGRAVGSAGAWAKRSDTPHLAEELWSRLDRAVEGQLVADVPVGVFLSGGIDSSIVATLAQRHASRPLKTFSIAFEDPTFDESAYARMVAQRIGSEHIEERLGEKNLLDVVDVALSRLDEPLADPSYLPTFLVSRLASQYVKVVLGGDGGDEIFGGYPTYRAHAYGRLYRLLPKGLRTGPIANVVARLRERDSYQSLEWKLRRFVLRWDDESRRRHLRWMSNLDLDDLRRGIPSSSGSVPASLEGEAPSFADALNELLALDFTTYLPSSVLTKVDRASMAHGLEVRPPLLDNDIVEWAFSLPSSLKLHRGQSKYLLKRSAKGRLPEQIIERPKKGFGIPLGRWMRGPLRDRLDRALRPSPLWESGLLDRETFVRWAKMNDSRVGDYSKALWALIVLDEWVGRERVDADQNFGQ